ncbi:MAG: DUF3471 domain-containing protein, partial [Acidimicrobiia bacterium]
WLRVNLNIGQDESAPTIAPATLRTMQGPQMVMGGMGGGIFPEISHYAYGLGWMIGQYRGHKQIEHGGGIDGFLTELMLLPDDNIGLVVLTNSTSSTVGKVIAYRVMDELLGLEPIDWHGRIKERYDAAHGGMKQARQARQRVDAPLPRAVEEYAGEYEHPGYGTFSIEVDKDRLVPRFGTLVIELVHRHFDVFDLEWRELTDDVTIFPLSFETGADGDVVGLSVPFEPSLDPIRFVRQPDARGKDPRVLKTLVGTYVMGPIDLEVKLKGESTLTVSSSMGGPAAELVAGRGLKFSVKGGGAQTVEFVLTDKGEVEKLVLQPAGVFTPKPS